ncbi:class II glutamine amidotransferase [Octadecabacter sp. G9-8]|uniref:Class II glutamine amidotransferase n=1 Tax=Octadecabacter dasysiphoniae TaxID=2909341 RepID=A0ABS9CYQ4_9RHOB|nr:class II glutamine amidotransferase [Octadecabacter dasysiphoniae]MCF2871203.1 class II glutamine amidotransferase [Octadecabacter dasysiphoniae]
MCRIAAYAGPSIPLENIIVRPKHSLLEQSQHATEAKLAVNGDGFGIAWYDRDETPGLYRDVLPAWADGNLTSLCRMVRSRLFIAHVRASTVGETSRQNCHPFSYRRWSFCHNGQIPHFAAIERKLEADLPDHLYSARQGSTDSEMIFLTLLANGLDDDPERAMAATLAKIGSGPDPVKITCTFSDGATLYGFRHASRGTAPTLYASGSLDNGGKAFASEPLDGGSWAAIPANKIISLGINQTA